MVASGTEGERETCLRARPCTTGGFLPGAENSARVVNQRVYPRLQAFMLHALMQAGARLLTPWMLFWCDEWVTFFMG